MYQIRISHFLVYPTEHIEVQDRNFYHREIKYNSGGAATQNLNGKDDGIRCINCIFVGCEIPGQAGTDEVA